MTHPDAATTLAPAGRAAASPLSSRERGAGGVRSYPAYRDSGVPWLGVIPAHWQVKRLKRLSTYVARGDSPDYVDESSIQVINQACVQWDGLHLESVKFQREADISNWESRLRRGDVLVNSTGTGTLGRTVDFEHSGNYMADGHVTIIRCVADLAVSRYVSYLLRTELYQGYIYSALVFGSTNQIELSREGLRAMAVILPPLAEQRAIAAYLDRETARIDALVAAKERLIALLREKRAALISRAVTRGLDPAAPMRDSGVPWLGEVPAHWQVKRTKFVARQESGHTPSRQHPEFWVDCTIPWVSLADVWQLRDGLKECIEDTNEYVSELGIANSSARLLPARTVIVSRTASVGFSGIMARPMATTQDFANWVCGPRITPEYLLYVFRSMDHEFRRLTMGSTHQTIYMPDIGRFSTPLPPVHEQQAIVEFIRGETAKLDALVAAIRRHIEKVREYRAALIAAAVTGKVDVRDEEEM